MNRMGESASSNRLKCGCYMAVEKARFGRRHMAMVAAKACGKERGSQHCGSWQGVDGIDFGSGTSCEV